MSKKIKKKNTFKRKDLRIMLEKMDEIFKPIM